MINVPNFPMVEFVISCFSLLEERIEMRSMNEGQQRGLQNLNDGSNFLPFDNLHPGVPIIDLLLWNC